MTLYGNERRCFHFRYLEHEHSLHCVPSNVSSGLASLPLNFVWFNGTKNTSWPTSKMLPKTSEELSGKRAYSMILPYFTTNEMTPLEVHQLGKEQLKKLYPLVSVDWHEFLWFNCIKTKRGLSYHFLRYPIISNRHLCLEPNERILNLRLTADLFTISFVLWYILYMC